VTGPEHYREAERLLIVANEQQSEDGPGRGSEETLADAQVHATLALAAATAWITTNQYIGIDGPIHEWAEVAGLD
jgi:hypothetical protein